MLHAARNMLLVLENGKTGVRANAETLQFLTQNGFEENFCPIAVNGVAVQDCDASALGRTRLHDRTAFTQHRE